MAALRNPVLALVTAGIMLSLMPVHSQAADAASAHASWQNCLGQAYGNGASLTGRDLAVDAALRSCRGEENAYLTALSSSPLLDADDIAQARPELVARARAALLTTGTRSVLR